MGVAKVTKIPELALDKDDAKQLSEAFAAVAAFHKMKMTPKQEAYYALIEAAGIVYMPMAASIIMRKQMEADRKKGSHLRPVPNNDTPTPIKPVPQPPPPKPATAAESKTLTSFDPLNIKLDS